MWLNLLKRHENKDEVIWFGKIESLIPIAAEISVLGVFKVCFGECDIGICVLFRLCVVLTL